VDSGAVGRPGLAPAEPDPGDHRHQEDRQGHSKDGGPTLPAPTALPSGPQSTVAAAFSQAMRPVAKAAAARIQILSDRDI